jgi:hypothetical protein
MNGNLKAMIFSDRHFLSKQDLRGRHSVYDGQTGKGGVVRES